MKEHGDAYLVEEGLRGNREALGVLLTRYEGPVYNAVFRMLRDPDDARDVTQTVFLKVMDNLESYDANFKFYSWLYRIAINESLNWLKRSARGGLRAVIPHKQFLFSHLLHLPGKATGNR